MTEQRQNSKELSVSNKSMNDGMEVDWANIFREIISIRKTLYKAAGIGLIVGIVVALSIPKKYTVQVTLSPEMGSMKSNNGLTGLAASFLGNGTTMGDNTDALNASLSSDIVSSTPFLLELLNMKVTPSKENNITLKEYLDGQSSPWWSYAIALPGVIINGIRLFLSTEEIKESTIENCGTIELTYKEASMINFLRKNLVAAMDKKSAITQITITLQDPKVTAIVADSVVQKLQEYIIRYRTVKAKEDSVYYGNLFKERQLEYYVAQKKYANYIDSHDNTILQSVRVEQERLQNDMNLAYQVYSQVANQLQVARAKIQEEKPVFAVVEPAVVPLEPSSMGMKIYVLLFIILSVDCTIGWKLIGKSFWKWLRKEIK